LALNDGNLVVSQQVKAKPSLGHYDKKNLNHIVPVEACDIFLERPWNFHSTFVYHIYFNEITFTYRGNRFVFIFSIPSQVMETNYKHS